MQQAFREALLKAKRANEHINDLERRLRVFCDSDSYTIHVNFDSDQGCDVLKVEPTKQAPDDLVLIVGDAVHNMRSALDYLISPFVFKSTEHAKFIISAHEQAFKAAINGGLKSNSTSEFRQFLADHVQPYGGGCGSVLFPLHKLDIADKHHLLIAKTQITLIEDIRGIDEIGMEFIAPRWLLVYPFIASYKCEGHRNITVTDKGKAACSMVFGKGMPLEGDLIPERLREMSLSVQSTINRFSFLYDQGLR
jgi:hypothetical protein